MCDTSATDASAAHRSVGADAARDPESGADGTASDPDAAADGIRRRAESIRRDELAVALRRLDGESALTDGQRRAVERMTERIAASVVAPATTALRAADSDREVTAALELFGGDSDGEPDEGCDARAADGRD